MSETSELEEHQDQEDHETGYHLGGGVIVHALSMVRV